jgi:succinate dehydrogenase/fumarate reductase flavoprotein subunit
MTNSEMVELIHAAYEVATGPSIGAYRKPHSPSHSAFRQGRRPGENEKKYISARCLSGRDELCNVVSCACACHGREQ